MLLHLKRNRTGVPLIPGGKTKGKGRFVLYLILLLFTSCLQDSDEYDSSAMLVKVGTQVPDFTLTSSDGKEISSSSLCGQVYILNFFDTECPDCQEVLPVMQQVYDKYHGNVPVLNVPRSQVKEEVNKYWEKAGLSMPFYIPHDKKLYYKFATSTIPRTYIVDEKGIVSAAFSDAPIADRDTLETLLKKMLDESGSRAGYVNLSLRVKLPPKSNDIDEYYFHNEYAVSYLEAWFFDAESKKFVTKSTLSGLSSVDTYFDTQYDITYLFKNIRLRVGVFDIFILANYVTPSHFENEMDFLNQVDSITYNEGIEANIPDSGPVMASRATSMLGVDMIPWANKDYMMSVDIERVMAKLQIGVSQNTFMLTHNQRKYAEINITNYKLVNMNRQYFLFQHRDSLPALTDEPEYTLPFHFCDYNDQDDQYVVDPLFYKKIPNREDATAVGRYYKSWFGTFTTEDFASMPSADNYGYAYVLENTAFKTSQKNGYSPGIVFKAAVCPMFVYLYDYDLKILKEEYRPEYWPKTIYLYNYNFYGTIQAVNIASGLSLDELVNYTDAQLKVHGIKQCKFNMGVYETFYTYWIRHRNSPADFMGPMEYGIVRNNFYKMVVTGVNGVGNSVITPDIMQDNYPNSYADVAVDFSSN